MRRRRTRFAAWLLCLAGCTPQASDVETGAYQFFAAASSLGEPSSKMRLDVDRANGRIRFSDGVNPRTDARLVWSADGYQVCPGGRREAVFLVEPVPLAVGTVAFARPALRGQCSDGLPSRVALIDLAVHDESSAIAHPVWIEFCRAGDFGCADMI